jgi:hypothetical protein
MLRQVSLLSTLLTLACLFYNARARIGAISIFRGDESIYHKYSAVLAAIDPFRSQLREDIKRTLGPLSKFFHGIRGMSEISVEYPSMFISFFFIFESKYPGHLRYKSRRPFKRDRH